MAGQGVRPASHRARPTAARPLRAFVCAAGFVASCVVGAVAGAPVALAAGEADPLLYVLQALAEEAGTSLVVGDTGLVTEADAVGDAGTERGYDDVVRASIASLPAVPPWLLEAFDCGAANVACAPEGSTDSPFSGGALIVGQRMAVPPALAPAGERGEWGPILALDQYPTAPIVPDNPFAGASHAVITRVEGDQRDVLAFAFVGGEFTAVRTHARSMWVGDDLLTLIPIDEELLTPPVGWDVYASSDDDSATGRDTIRGLEGAPLLALAGPLPEVTFEPAVSSSGAAPSGPAEASASSLPSAPPSASPSAPASSAVAPTATGPASVTTSPGPSSSPATDPIAAIAGIWDSLLFWLLLGLMLALLGLALLARRSDPPPGNPPTTHSD